MKHFISKLIFLLAILILPGIDGQAQTTQGTDFWVSFGKNRNKTAAEVNLQIRVVATKATKVTYTFTSNGATVTKDIAAGEVNTFVLTDAQKALVYQATSPTVGALISKLSLYIQSTEPVSVYALNQVQYWTDATNLLPVNTLGTDYYHISYVPSNTTGSAGDVTVGAYFDGYTIVAIEDGTNIYLNGSTTPKNATPLTKGQVYSVYEYGKDMTGYHITSNNPIALFSTNVCARVPSDKNASDLLYQQMVPVCAWGKNHFVPATIREMERVRIVASEDNTTITQTGGTVKSGSLSNLSKGHFVELEIKLATGGGYISADKPVGVCSYLVGSYATSVTYVDGDPSLAWVPPVEQFVDAATIAPFAPGTATALTAHYAQIIARTSALGETTMSIGTGASTALSGGTWTTGANPDYSFYNLPLTNTTQSYTFANPTGLAIMGYGLGHDESYYYLAASAARDFTIPATATFYVDGELYSAVNRRRFCGGAANFQIKAVLQNISPSVGYLKWFVDGAEQTAVAYDFEWELAKSLLGPGDHTIRMLVTDQNNQTYDYETMIRICAAVIPVNHYIRQ
jgi:hypothetical protein